MGTGYNRNVSQWSKGEYFDANQLQDDLQVISGRVPYRSDDHGGTAGTATPLQVSGGTTISSSTPETDPSNTSPANKGVIERNTDVDVFSFYTGAGSVQLNVRPWIQPSGTRGGNLDVLMELYDETGALVASNNAASLTTATISTSLGEGYHYLHVRNSGTGTPLVSPPSGYTSYGSIGQYFISGTIVAADAPPVLTGITPSSGFIDTVVTLDISGSGISTDTEFKLSRPGQNDIVAASVSAAGSLFRCEFDLTGAATGAWSVVATNPDLETSVLADAFTVVGAIWTENFDGAMSGWTSEATTGSNSWSLSTAQSDSPTTSYFAAGPSSKSTTNLISPTIPIPSGASNLQLRFRHFHTLELGRDAGKLELSVDNGGSWFDVTSNGSGASFASYPYNGTISSRGGPSSRNEFAGQSAWTGNSGGFVETVVNLTDNAKFSGANLRLRWRLATDSNTPSAGWYVDSISLTGDGNFSNQPPAIATAASSTSTETVTDPDGTIYQIIRGSSAALSVSATDDAGEPGLAYTWAVTSGPDAPVSFGPNGNNASRDTTATFQQAGDYLVTATVTDAEGLAVSSSVALRVVQTASEIAVTPSAATVVVGGTQVFNAVLADQFGTDMAVQPPSFSWQASGGGSMSAAGLFSATSAGGPFAVTATSGSISGSADVTVTPATAGISFDNLVQTYDGTPKPISIITTPPGLAVSITYNGSSDVPVNAGSYAVAATVTDANYEGSGTSSLVIGKAVATVTLGGLEQTSDGTPKSVTAMTEPAGLAVSITYDGSATAPSEAGSYAVVATVTDANHQGSANGTFVIAPGNDWLSWRNLAFTETQIAEGLAEEGADPDGDKLANLAEYALGSDPLAFTPPFVATLDGTGLWFTFTRPAGLPDVTYAAESSDGLGTWQPALLEVIGTGETETVRARDPLATGDPARRFLRLRFATP